MLKRTPIRTILGMALLAAGTLSSAQATYPAKYITLVVPTGAGGGTDVVARRIGLELGKRLGTSVVVENRSGANGAIGLGAVARAKPDGATLLFGYTTALVVNPHISGDAPFDTLKDFTPIAQIGVGGNALIANPNAPFKDVKGLIAYAKATPGGLSYCSWGTGSGGHLALNSVAQRANAPMIHVPYRSSSACASDVVAGHLSVGFADLSSTIPLVEAGKLTMIAHSGPAPVPKFPNVPSLAQSGFPFPNYSWYGIFAPAGLSPELTHRLNKEINSLLDDPAVKKTLAELNFDQLPKRTPEEFKTQIAAEYESWGKLVKSSNVKSN